MNSTRNFSARRMRAAVAGTLALAIAVSVCGAEDSRFKRFAAENDAAMARMMGAMHVALSGDVDRDFATMMIPHHQGAIDMARAELSFGRDEKLRRIAQAIVIDQAQEIEAMNAALRALPGAPALHKGHMTP